MNPLDVEEFNEFKNIMSKDMPLHTDTTMKVKGMFGNFPKNIMEYSSHIDDIFLNNYQHIIEECEVRNPSNNFVKSFLLYQDKHYEKYGILKGDNIFKRIINSKHRASGGNLASVFVSFGSHVNGATLNTSNGTGADSGSFGNTLFQVYRCKDAGTVGQFYNQVAMDVVLASGSLKLAVYDGDTSNPNNLYQQTTSFASAVNYDFQSLTEFALTTTTAWTAFNNTASGMHPRDNSPGDANSDRQTVAQVFATSFTTPAPGGRTDAGHTDIAVMKTGHS